MDARTVEDENVGMPKAAATSMRSSVPTSRERSRLEARSRARYKSVVKFQPRSHEVVGRGDGRVAKDVMSSSSTSVG
jgi:hypothetical protein